jgi:D-lactate dehydrogenase (cytochrome)
MRVPLIPFGTGTSLEGHIQAIHGGVCLDLSEMNAILQVNELDMDCRVQAGVTRLALNSALRHSGLSFPIDPGADASLGGMAACGASGTAAVRYGTMRENVLGTTAVLADGTAMTTGGRARKSSAGYDLTRLLVGSEGTLAILTELQLRLHPLPAACSAAVCTFDSLEAGARAVAAVLQCGIPVARCELLDASAIRAFNAYPKEVADLRAVPTLFLEFTGISAESVAEQAELAHACCADEGGSEFTWATSEEERRRLWQARHSTYYASLALRPGSRGIVTDAAVPISRLAEVMRATADDVAAEAVVGPIFGHAGDGNFHVILPVRDDDSPEYVAALKRVNDRLVRRTLAVGGTCTGEHGVGVGKREYLALQHGEAAVAAMRAIKRALDPLNILNPGKVVDVSRE